MISRNKSLKHIKFNFVETISVLFVGSLIGEKGLPTLIKRLCEKPFALAATV
jgi:hypothetical protein